jgi:hypothetical protein
VNWAEPRAKGGGCGEEAEFEPIEARRLEKGDGDVPRSAPPCNEGEGECNERIGCSGGVE